MDYPLNKVILMRVFQRQSWWFLSKIFMESQRLNVGKLNDVGKLYDNNDEDAMTPMTQIRYEG